MSGVAPGPGGLDVKVDLHEVLDLARELQRDVSPVRDIFVRRMNGVAAVLQGEVRATAPVFTGELVNGIQLREAHVVATGPTIALRAEVYTSLPHGVVMEEGRAPGKWPPFAPIHRWVQLKVRRGDMTVAGSRNEESAIRSIAFLVQRKIGQQGIAARKFFEKAARKIEPLFEQQMDAAADEAARLIERPS